MDFWEDVYKGNDEELPWFSKKLDGDIKKWLRDNPGKWDILSVGEGPGTQAIALAKLGFAVTGTDISKNAIRHAKKRAAGENVDVRFVVDDVLDTKIHYKFSVVIDRGCFHVIPPEKRALYIKNVSSLLQRDGFLMIKTFSAEETQTGPYKFTKEKLRALFNGCFIIDEIKETQYEGALKRHPKALFASMRLR